VQPFTQPIDRLREAVRWFVAAPELRLLHVVASPELRVAALQTIASSQSSEYNRSVYVFSQTPAAGAPADWEARAAEVDDDMASARESAAAATPAVVIPSPPPMNPPASGLSRFAATLRGHSSVLRAPLAGMIAILAPPAVVDPATWVADLRQLVQSPALDRVRFIVVEPEPGPARAVADELGRAADHVDARVDPAASTSLTRAMLAGIESAPKGADPARIAGMAGPKEAPPPRVDRTLPSPETAAEELSSVGVAPGLGDPDAMQALRVKLMSASLAQQEGRKDDAIRAQREARDLAERAGLARESILLDLMLGAHLVQAGGYATALQTFDRVIERARTASMPQLEAQALMAKGGVLLVQQRPHDAAAVYTSGARVAEAANARPFAIECFRMVGQILASLGNEAEAGTAFHRALAVAKSGEPLDRATSSAPVAARDLAAIYRKSGLTAQAASLEAEAEKWQAEVPEVPAPDAAPPTAAPSTAAAPAPDGFDGDKTATAFLPGKEPS
jgi:tetratricopeptide (TPR) repeat protein